MYQIRAIELYVRETPPGRMLFALGRPGAAGVPGDRVNPLAHVRMIVRDDEGNETFGCAGDRLSVRWLDKREGRTRDEKRRALVERIEAARGVYLEHPRLDTPFAQWRRCHPRIMEAGRKAGEESLTSAFASALFERALIDAVCRLRQLPLFRMLAEERLGVDPAAVHPELKDFRLSQWLRERPRMEFSIRHTVGLADPLTDDEIPAEQRVGDGLPESLAAYIRNDGLRHFKIKISGDPRRDFERLERIWAVVQSAREPVITLDANEAYHDLAAFGEFVASLEERQIGLFQHIAYIEQPLPRALTWNADAAAVKEIAARKPLIIDEADGSLDAFGRALALGYSGVSHKNCKGFFKSLLNHLLAIRESLAGREAFLSGEDLQNLPVVPLQQDFAALGVLGLEHCERNGHHYNYGLALLSETDKRNAVLHHPDLYVRRGDEWFLNIRDGKVHCDSLQCAGFGVRDEPDWNSMEPMRKWLERRHSA